MVELLLDDYVLRIWIIRIVGFVTSLLGEIYLASSLVSLIPATVSSAVVIIIVKISLQSPPGVLLKLFRYTVLLEMAYFVASPASNIDASPWPNSEIFFFLFLA